MRPNRIIESTSVTDKVMRYQLMHHNVAGVLKCVAKAEITFDFGMRSTAAPSSRMNMPVADYDARRKIRYLKYPVPPILVIY